jgi:hypothetical protein
MQFMKLQIRSLWQRTQGVETHVRVTPGFAFVIKAFVQLVRFERVIAHHQFAELYDKVRSCRTNNAVRCAGDMERICAAVDIASICYPKQILCLQRSAATICLLRKHGILAELVIGARQLPFKAHAWVESGGRVVNDNPYMREIYTVLDRC